MDLSFYAQAHLDTKAEKVCAILQKIQPGEIVSLLFSHCKHRFSQTCLLVGDLPIFLAMYFIPLCSTLLFFHVMSPELCLRFLCQAEEAIHQASAPQSIANQSESKSQTLNTTIFIKSKEMK